MLCMTCYMSAADALALSHMPWHNLSNMHTKANAYADNPQPDAAGQRADVQCQGEAA